MAIILLMIEILKICQPVFIPKTKKNGKALLKNIDSLPVPY
jgi:hypothetical protein